MHLATKTAIVFVVFLLGFLQVSGQRQLKIIAPPGLNPFPPTLYPINAFHDCSKDSAFSIVAYNSPTPTSYVLSLYPDYQLSVVSSIAFPISNLAAANDFAVLVKQQSNANNYDLVSWDMYYSAIYSRRKLTFTGLTVPSQLNMTGSSARGGEVALYPPGSFSLQAGLGDFGWYVVDDQLNYVTKRSISCGTANTGESGGCFLENGGMIYVGAATFSGTNQKYNVVVAADSANLNPTRVVRLRRASGGHLSLSKVSECSAGILLADLVQNIVVLVDHGLTQVLWAKRLPPYMPLYSVPIEGQAGILHGTMGYYTSIPWPGFPFGITDLDWAHFGLNIQNGGLVYGRRINSVYAPPFSTLNVIMPPFMHGDGQLREIKYLTDDYHSEWHIIEVDTTGYLGCDQLAFTPVFVDDTILLDVLSGWTVDNVGAGTLSYLAPTSYSMLNYDSLEIECECNPQLSIVATPVSPYTFQFSLTSSSYYFGTINWDFGDSTQATGNTPTHTFPGPGTYQVVACKDFFCGTRCDTLQLTVTNCPIPNVAFTYSGALLNFSFNSSGSQGSLLWQFGDGGTSTLANPSHTYSTAGTYSVCLVATNFCTSDTLCQTITVICPPPPAFFSWSNTNLTATFNPNGSYGNVYSWSFGDGTYSGTTWAPSHTYTFPGTYNVCFTTANSCGSTTFCNSVTVTCPAPLSSFTHSAFNLSVAFTNTGGLGAHLWQFGDGSTSPQTNPTHLYTNAGTYNVCHTVTSMCGSSTTCQTITVTCPNLPSATFSQTSSLLTATFSSAGSTGSLQWDFGDGNGSTQSNPTHVYAAPGTYTACLIATNSCGADTLCQSVTVTCPLPTASFSQTSNLLTTSFISAGSTGSLQWDFGDGNGSTQANPTHAYAAPGTYTVCLIATNSCGADTLCQSGTVTCPLPTASFSQTSNLLTTSFISAGSTGSLQWDFGDGNGSTQANPTHAYAAPGTYTVCLIATNSCGADTLCQSVTVTCPLPSANFAFLGSGLTYQFQDMSSASSNFQLNWDFGDGNTSTQSAPTHTYSSYGNYVVCLWVTDVCGTDSLCQNLTIVGQESVRVEQVEIFPQPADQGFYVVWTGILEPIEGVSVYGLDGKCIRNFGRNAISGTNLMIDTKDWSSGIYLLRLSTATQQAVRRITIVR